jgi:hypothetical protein
LNAIHATADAWAQVSQETIINCWKKTGILFEEFIQNEVVATAKAFEQEQHDVEDEIAHLIDAFNYDNSMSAAGSIFYANF